MKMQNIIIAVLALIILVGGAYTLHLHNLYYGTDVAMPGLTPCVQSATTADCSKLTPLGTPYTPPTEEEAKPWADTTQTGKVDEHLTIDNALRDVNFCGNTYKVKQVMIDGIDVVQRIAELTTSNQDDPSKKYVCDNALLLRSDGWIHLENEIGIPTVENKLYQGASLYTVILVDPLSTPFNTVPVGEFVVNVTTGDIFIVVQKIDGSSNELFGKLK